MEGSLLEKTGISTESLVLVLAILVLIYTGLMVFWLIQSRKMFQRYDIFMRGKEADTLEDVIAENIDKVANLQQQDLANKDILKALNRNLVNTYQKTGIVKYNAFEGMGGQASFVLTMLDLNNNGFLINVIHSRNTCYTYLKEIHNGSAEVVLGAEEKESLMQAMKKKDRFYDTDEDILNE